MGFNAFNTKSDDTYTFTFNAETPEYHGVFLYDYPKISRAKQRYETKTVAGAMGQLIEKESDVAYDNITIDVTLSVLHKKFSYRAEEVKNWLRGSGVLQLSDMTDRFYKVLHIEQGDVERDLRRYGRCQVTFICFPYEFMEDGERLFSPAGLLYNAYDVAMPVYTITGNGDCTLTLNGKSLTATVGETLTIDTLRQEAYKVRGGQALNTSVKGDYENLWLPHGNLNLSVTSGFTVEIQPNWGWIA